MSEQIKLIKELLDHVEAYKLEVGNTDIKEFSIYLKDKVLIGKPNVRNLAFDKNNFQQYKTYPEVEFSTLLTSLYRFARHYVKKAFIKTSIKTIDEFGFLATLLKEKSLLKNELIQKHLLEISSGSEIIKRLMRHELIYEYPDVKDKRAKRVSLTEKGIGEVMIAFEDMHKVSEIVIGNLKKEELNEALSVFNKLNFFHLHIHEEDKHSSLVNLHDKYVSGKKVDSE